MSQNPLSISPDQNPQIEGLISKLLSDFSHQYGLDLSQDPAAMERLREAVEKAALDLENQPDAVINLPYISANSAGPIHFRRHIQAADLEPGSIDARNTAQPRQPRDSSRPAAQERVKIQLPDKKPIVTYSLLVVIALIYTVQMLTDQLLGYDLPAAIGMKHNELIIAGQYWRLITAMFLHGSIFHLGFNLYALYILGRRVERFFGSFRFLGLFIIAGITGNLFSFVFTQAPSLGSSTAIFGLLGAEGVFIYQHRNLFGDQSKVALRQIIQVAAINLLIGLSPGIDNWGHLGGLIGGAIFSWFGGPLF
ncbi:MAG: rhomboid family intramembrane serine protease, partial [Anaerolineales bacterium]|nr:rhomboid family intramembrane serine protease [Anaerolineales bacterium]